MNRQQICDSAGTVMLGSPIPSLHLISLPYPIPTRSEPHHNTIVNCISHPQSSCKLQFFPSSTGLKFKQCEFIDLHKELVPYDKAWALQKAIVKEKKELIRCNEDCPDTLIILQHPSVYTLGTGSSEEYLNFNKNDAPFDIFRTERGGEVTYHGPGQLVMYPIMNLRNHKMDLHWYLRALEEVVIRALSSTFSINASRLEGFTGVWVGDQKLAAIGIRVSQWVAYHGLALNVSVDLSPFRKIVPCGIRNRGVGSIKGVLAERQTYNYHETRDFLLIDDSQLMDLAYRSLVQEFFDVFQIKVKMRFLTLSDLLQEECPKY